MKMCRGGSVPGSREPSRTSEKVSLLCSFLGRVTIMRSVRFHQAEEDRTTLQMHTSPLSFQCNNTCRAWWGGRRDGLVWESARTLAYMQKVTHTCIYTWEITESNKTHPHGKHVAHKACRVGFESVWTSSIRRCVSIMCECCCFLRVDDSLYYLKNFFTLAWDGFRLCKETKTQLTHVSPDSP